MAFSSGGSSDNEDNVLAEINMIPFIDIMLVLLIISMVATPFLEQGLNVELPVAVGENLGQSEILEESVTLFVGKDLNLRLGEEVVTREDLAARLSALFGGRSGRELFVRADKDVPYGVVAEVMSRVQAAGIERVGLVTLPD